MQRVKLELNEHDAYRLLALVEQEAKNAALLQQPYWLTLADCLRRDIEISYGLTVEGQNKQKQPPDAS
jgi:hypothetical protein